MTLVKWQQHLKTEIGNRARENGKNDAVVKDDPEPKNNQSVQYSCYLAQAMQSHMLHDTSSRRRKSEPGIIWNTYKQNLIEIECQEEKQSTYVVAKYCGSPMFKVTQHPKTIAESKMNLALD